MTSALILALAVPLSAAPARIGAAGAVAGRVTAAAPEAARRALASGGEVYHKDAVATGPQSRLQVLLLDETVFTVGPDSEVTLDEFVYDPFTDAGKVSAQVTKGVFRFVTGKVARRKPEGMKVKLPVGTVGIRGTIAAGKVEGDSALVALLGPGRDNNADERPGGLTVENAGVSVDIDEPGMATRIPGPGEPPTPPFPLTPELLAELSPAPPAGGGEEGAPAQGASAEQESGQETAAARETSGESIALGAEEEDLEQTSSFAAQDTLTGGGFTWDKFSELTAGLGGSAVYFGQGSYFCTGGGCSSGSSGQFSFHFNVDWANRTLGGGGSSSHIAFTESGSSGYLNQTPGPAPGLIEATIPVINFDALSGTAKLTFGTDFTAANGNNAFNGSSFEFKDEKSIDVSMTYNGNNQTAGGAGLISHASGTSASGSATATCSGTCP